MATPGLRLARRDPWRTESRAPAPRYGRASSRVSGTFALLPPHPATDVPILGGGATGLLPVGYGAADAVPCFTAGDTPSSSRAPHPRSLGAPATARVISAMRGRSAVRGATGVSGWHGC